MKTIWLEVQCKSFSPSDLAVNKSIQKSYKPAKRKLEKKKAIKGLKAVCTQYMLLCLVIISFALTRYQ